MKTPPASLLLLFLTSVLSSLPAAQPVEIGRENFSELPGGKEADGIVGDFVLRNDRVEAVISGNLPLRRANMGTFYGDGNETPGCLYDLTLRGANNDQITIFSPSSQKGPVSYVRIVDNPGKAGAAAVETVVTPARSGGASVRHEYRVEDGWQGVLITSRFHNPTKNPVEIKVNDAWSQMRSKGSVRGIQWADAIDPADKCGYAFAWVKSGEATIPESSILKLEPGAGATVARFLAVGRSPAEAIGVVAEWRGDPVGRLHATLADAAGGPVASGRVMVSYDPKNAIPAYPDEKGALDLPLSHGSYAVSVEDIGRPSKTESLEISGGTPVEAAWTLDAAAVVAFSITDEKGVSLPCKAQFNPLGDTPKPDLGPRDRAHGCADQYHSENGSFHVPLPPGKYRVVVTHGPEYSHFAEEITLAAGQTHEIKAQLKRLVDTAGWVSADYHNHSTPSGDNVCGTDDRIINLAAEQIEFAPTTEHNRLYDWEPHISALGLTPFLKTIPGMELTGRGAHLNCFPLTPDPTSQDGGAPVWKKDPRLNAITLRDWQAPEPDRWVHVNHPDMIEDFIDQNRDGKPDGGFAYFGGLIDALESQNYRPSEILATAPYRIVTARTGLGREVFPIREFIWLQLLNQGLRLWGIAVSDAHYVHGNGVGGWRTYVKSSTDDPAEIDWRELSRNSKAGRMILSTGPFLEVETGSGIIAGGLDRSSGDLPLKVRVQCTDWLDIDRVQVLVNGRQVPEYNFTREKNPDMFGDGVVKFDHDLTVKLSQDSHLIVVAAGEKQTLITGFGSSGQSELQPIAYHNPIYVDVDGGGFSPSHDTLGFDLPVAGLKVEDVKHRLGEK